jgi:hypothetical protein
VLLEVRRVDDRSQRHPWHGQRFFYVCASHDRRGHAVCDNALRLPMTLADAILFKRHDYVLGPPVVETAIHNAIADCDQDRKSGIGDGQLSKRRFARR